MAVSCTHYSDFLILFPLQNSLLIGSRLDDATSGQSCRLAMHGRIVSTFNLSSGQAISGLKIYKLKQKEGSIERVLPDGKTAVCKGLFKKESDISVFAEMKVILI